MAYMDLQIRRLPYGILKKLGGLLDVPGPRDWKALISVMPNNTYRSDEVRKCTFLDYVYLHYSHLFYSLRTYNVKIHRTEDEKLHKGVFIIHPLGGGAAKSWGGQKSLRCFLRGSLEFQDS